MSTQRLDCAWNTYQAAGKASAAGVMRGLMFNLSGRPDVVRRARVINDAASPFLIKTFTQNNKEHMLFSSPRSGLHPIALSDPNKNRSANCRRVAFFAQLLCATHGLGGVAGIL